MKKEIRKTKDGVVQITTVDERWYVRKKKNKKTGLPEYQFVPSVTWIAESYPKGIGFYKWLAAKGWDEAEAIKAAAGDKGSKVHQAIEDLIVGKEVGIASKYRNSSNGEKEELSLEEYECLMSFVDWFEKVRPEIIKNEMVVFNDEHNYAGTVDFIARINGDPYIIDFKTSQSIWPSHEIQVSAYAHTKIDQLVEEKPLRLAILQLGYRRNQKNWKFTEVEDKFDLFLAAKQIWANENEGVEPGQKDFPLTLSLGVKKESQKASNQRSGK